jgi:hypothetical protein
MSTFHRLNKNVGEFVLAKFMYKCTNCSSEIDLCIHHIIKKSPKDEDYNDVENLTVLCRSCHMSHHMKENDIVPFNGIRNGRRGKVSSNILCSYDNCNDKQHAKGLCRKHYRITFPEKFYSKKEQMYRKNCIIKQDHT